MREVLMIPFAVLGLLTIPIGQADAFLGRDSGDGLVRVLLAVRDDLRKGIDVLLPEGGTVRDGRTTPVATSFPIRVPAGQRVRITYRDGFSQAEVLDDRSVSDTVEITPTTGSAEPTTTTSTSPPPPLAASERSLWIEPRHGGRLVLAPEVGAERHTYRGLTEIVMEAERLHVVVELDVEEYLTGLDLATSPDGTALEPATLETAVIAARTYALRAARTEPRVGRFHLYADERSLPYIGPDEAPAAVARAARATRGKVLSEEDDPAGAGQDYRDGGGGGSNRLPLVLIGAAGLSLLVAFGALSVADVQRRVQRIRDRRAARRHHPTGV